VHGWTMKMKDERELARTSEEREKTSMQWSE
jgi:hypothetical protein